MKRGFLLGEETLKIVIAVICIGFLVYFLTSMYFRTQGDVKLEQAEATLDRLIEEINAKSPDVEIYNPEGWVVVSWPHNVLKGTIGLRKVVNDIPNSCKNLGWNDCICICKSTLALNLEGQDCDKKGVCRQNSMKMNGEVIKIDPIPLILKINYGNEITITK